MQLTRAGWEVTAATQAPGDGGRGTRQFMGLGENILTLFFSLSLHPFFSDMKFTLIQLT